MFSLFASEGESCHPLPACTVELEQHLASCSSCREACVRAWFRFADSLTPTDTPPRPCISRDPQRWKWAIRSWVLLGAVIVSLLLSAFSVAGWDGFDLALERVLSVWNGGLVFLGVLAATALTVRACWPDECRASETWLKRPVLVLVSTGLVLLCLGNVGKQIDPLSDSLPWPHIAWVIGVCNLAAAMWMLLARAIHPHMCSPHPVCLYHAGVVVVLLLVTYLGSHVKALLNSM